MRQSRIPGARAFGPRMVGEACPASRRHGRVMGTGLLGYEQLENAIENLDKLSFSHHINTMVRKATTAEMLPLKKERRKERKLPRTTTGVLSP